MLMTRVLQGLSYATIIAFGAVVGMPIDLWPHRSHHRRYQYSDTNAIQRLKFLPDLKWI